MLPLKLWFWFRVLEIWWWNQSNKTKYSVHQLSEVRTSSTTPLAFSWKILIVNWSLPINHVHCSRKNFILGCLHQIWRKSQKKMMMRNSFRISLGTWLGTALVQYSMFMRGILRKMLRLLGQLSISSLKNCLEPVKSNSITVIADSTPTSTRNTKA